MTIYDAFKIEEYAYKGKKRRKPYRVGRMIPNRDGGFSLFIPEGISISGRILIIPEGGTELDLLQAYESAADEYGT